jgi:hypothetical protein
MRSLNSLYKDLRLAAEGVNFNRLQWAKKYLEQQKTLSFEERELLEKILIKIKKQHE